MQRAALLVLLLGIVLLTRDARAARAQQELPVQEGFEQNSIPAFYVDQIKIAAPRAYEEVYTYLATIHRLLESHRGSRATIRYGKDRPLTVLLPYLGRGQNGAVYEIAGEKDKKVIKIPFGNPYALHTCKEEAEAYLFWQEQSKDKAFAIPKEYATNSFGLFRISEKIAGETLTKALIRWGLLRTKVDNPQEIVARIAEGKMDKEPIKKIHRALKAMRKIMLKYPRYATSLSPDNIIVAREKRGSSWEWQVTLVDIGVCVGKLKIYEHMESFADYLTYAANRLEKYLHSPIYEYEQPALRRLLMNYVNND